MKTKFRFPSGSRRLLVVFLLLLTGWLTESIIVYLIHGIQDVPELIMAVSILIISSICLVVAYISRDPAVLRTFKRIMYAYAFVVFFAAIIGFICEEIFKKFFVDVRAVIPWVAYAALIAYMFGRVEKQARQQKRTCSTGE
jgi:hypothetical protein